MTKQKTKDVKHKESYVFTVMDECNEKPIIYAEKVDRDLGPARENNHEISVELVTRWFKKNHKVCDMPDDDEISDIAYCMRKDGKSWYDSRFCFELTHLLEKK